MQAACPNCQQKIVIDDAKVPDRAFSVKCPKCQNVVKFPGKAAAAAAPPAAIPAEEDDWTAAPAPSSEPAPSLTPAMKTMGQGLRAIVALPDRNAATAVSNALSQLAFGVDTVENPDEGARLIEQGVYYVAVTSMAAIVAGKETLYQRISRLNPENRRRLFLTVLGEEFKTGDGIQAWSICADLVVNPRDAGSCAPVVGNTIAERNRVYQAFNESRRRFEESAS